MNDIVILFSGHYSLGRVEDDLLILRKICGKIEQRAQCRANPWQLLRQSKHMIIILIYTPISPICEWHSIIVQWPLLARGWRRPVDLEKSWRQQNEIAHCRNPPAINQAKHDTQHAMWRKKYFNIMKIFFECEEKKISNSCVLGVQKVTWEGGGGKA